MAHALGVKQLGKYLPLIQQPWVYFNGSSVCKNRAPLQSAVVPQTMFYNSVCLFSQFFSILSFLTFHSFMRPKSVTKSNEQLISLGGKGQPCQLLLDNIKLFMSNDAIKIVWLCTKVNKKLIDQKALNWVGKTSKLFTAMWAIKAPQHFKLQFIGFP